MTRLLRSVALLACTLLDVLATVKPDLQLVRTSSAVIGGGAFIESGVGSRLSAASRFRFENLCLSPFKPPPSDFELLKLPNFFEAGEGDCEDMLGDMGDEGSLVSFLASVGLDNVSACCPPVFCPLRMVSTPKGGLKGLFPCSSLPAKACSVLADTLSTWGCGLTGEGLKPRTWCSRGANRGRGPARRSWRRCAEAFLKGRCGSGVGKAYGLCRPADEGELMGLQRLQVTALV